MRISEVVDKLQSMKDILGDVEVIVCDTDTRWATKLQEHNITEYKGVVEIYFDSYQQFMENMHDYD